MDLKEFYKKELYVAALAKTRNEQSLKIQNAKTETRLKRLFKSSFSKTWKLCKKSGVEIIFNQNPTFYTNILLDLYIEFKKDTTTSFFITMDTNNRITYMENPEFIPYEDNAESSLLFRIAEHFYKDEVAKEK